MVHHTKMKSNQPKTLVNKYTTLSWLSGVSPNHCQKTLPKCSLQGYSEGVHGDLCKSREDSSECIPTNTYTNVASMQRSSWWAVTLIATTLVWCIDIQGSHWRYTEEGQYKYKIYISLHIGHPTLWSCRVHPTVGGQVFSLASGCV